MKISTIIFDFDGTLADSLAPTVDAFNQVSSKYGLPEITQAELPRLREMSARELLQKFRVYPWKLTRLIHDVQHGFSEQIDTVRPFPEIPQLIQQLKRQGFRLGIVTSNTQQNVERFLMNHQINEFEFVVAEKSLFGKSKVLKKVLNQQHILATQALYIGDEVRDIDACKKIGLPIIAVSWGFNSRERLAKADPEYLIDRISDIYDIIT